MMLSSARCVRNLEKGLLLTTGILLLLTLVEISLLAKCLTFAVRFTPEPEQPARSSSYFVESQLAIIILSVFYLITLPILAVGTTAQNKTHYAISFISYLIISLLLLVAVGYFLHGGAYRARLL